MVRTRPVFAQTVTYTYIIIDQAHYNYIIIIDKALRTIATLSFPHIRHYCVVLIITEGQNFHS